MHFELKIYVHFLFKNLYRTFVFRFKEKEGNQKVLFWMQFCAISCCLYVQFHLSLLFPAGAEALVYVTFETAEQAQQ